MDDLVKKLLEFHPNSSDWQQLQGNAQQYQPYAEYTWEKAAQEFKEQFLDICKDYYYI